MRKVHAEDFSVGSSSLEVVVQTFAVRLSYVIENKRRKSFNVTPSLLESFPNKSNVIFLRSFDPGTLYPSYLIKKLSLKFFI